MVPVPGIGRDTVRIRIWVLHRRMHEQLQPMAVPAMMMDWHAYVHVPLRWHALRIHRHRIRSRPRMYCCHQCALALKRQRRRRLTIRLRD